MKRIGRVLSMFAGSAALALAFAAPANAAPTLNVPEVPQVPGMPRISDLPEWATDLVPDDSLPDPAPDPTPGPGPDPTPNPAPNPPQPRNAPCAVEAKACIDLSDQTAWLQDGKGTITRGPVSASSGRPGYETPVGTTRVTRKDADWWSSAYDAPMPFSVFFSAGTSYPSDIGIAFHEGDPNVLSHGCIHLLHDDAVAFFNTLQVGDVVDVVA